MKKEFFLCYSRRRNHKWSYLSRGDIINRTSGPALELFQRKHGICVVSGFAKVKGLTAALYGGLVSELIIDEPTARMLVEKVA